MQPGFSNTLKWFYSRSTNPKDKKHCLRLLAQIELKGQDPKNSAVSRKYTRKPSTDEQATLKRPLSAQVATRTKVNFQSDLTRPKTGVARESTSKLVGYAQKSSQSTSTEQATRAENKFSTYQHQLELVDRLSRPKTAKRLTYTTHTRTDPRPKSAMATIGNLIYHLS